MNSARPPRNDARRAVAVLLSRFPAVTETFILREVAEMERQGQPVLLVPLIRDEPDVVHAQAAPWAERALYTPFVSPEILAANLRALRRSPKAYLSALVLVLSRTWTSWNLFLRSVALFPKSVYLAERLTSEGIRHVHAHFATHPATMALVISRLSGISFSITAHAHDIFVRRHLLREKIREARFVRVISDFNRRYLIDRYPDEAGGKLVVIHVGVPVEKYADLRREDTAAESAESPEHEPFRILCVAALRTYKGHPVLVEACGILARAGIPFLCDVVGEGPDRHALEERIRESHLEDRIRLLGARPEEDVTARLGRSDLFVLPSVIAEDGQMEGIPVALMEAMAAGLPVVASRLSGIPELVEEGVNGLLVPPGDAQSLAEAIVSLTEDPVGARAMGEAARRKVGRHFDLRRSVAALLERIDRHNPPWPLESVVPPLESRAQTVGVRAVLGTHDSNVAELLVEADGGTTARIVKVHRSRPGQSRPPSARAEIEFQTLSTMRELLDPERGVPRPLALDAGAGAIVMEPCRGRSLERILRQARARWDPRSRQESEAAVRRAGDWLRHFQDRTMVDEDGSARLLALVERARRDLDASRGLLPPRSPERIIERMRQLATEADPLATRMVGRHGDFWPGNVHVGEGTVEVIDFEGFGAGLPYEDAAYFLAHLRLLHAYPILRHRGKQLSGSFVAGYLTEDTIDLPTFELCRLAVSARLLAQAASRQGNGHGPGRQRRELRSMIVGSGQR